MMNQITKIVSVVAACVAFSGCTSTMQRALVTGAGGAAAGAVGYVASDEDPLITGAAAAGGAMATAALMGPDPAVEQKGFDQGYVQGQADAIKRQYWLRQNLQREQAEGESTDEGQPVYYVVPGPEKTGDGKKLEPHTVTVPVVE